MLIAALVMAVIGLIALVTAVVTTSEVFAWVCIGASVIGVILLIIDALRERRSDDASPADDGEAEEKAGAEDTYDADYPEEQSAEEASDDEDGAEAEEEQASDSESSR
jgi:hypothetical protein